MDLFDCFRKTLGDSVKITTGVFKSTFDFESVCEGKDVSAANGKTLAELGAAEDKLCADVTVASQRSLSTGRLTLVVATEGKTAEIETEFHSAFGSAALAPCSRRRDTAKQQWTQDDGCINFYCYSIEWAREPGTCHIFRTVNQSAVLRKIFNFCL